MPQKPQQTTKDTPAPQYWYETQERAFAPGIGDGWPKVVAAPHTKNARLVRRNGDPVELLAALKELVEAAEFDFCGESTNDCDDNESVAMEDGSAFTFGIIRRARAVLDRAGR